eukprot:TRINITY_DN1356_c0_g1_i1.p1 TRINITY_DN1356_c0_g1~~TRINITY_DN1356_c0_g1_i1.p1  ORF type:complete len:625 (-),score=175.62 TRINITY_DN1356_c0_g1_i1:425-2299(-)
MQAAPQRPAAVSAECACARRLQLRGAAAAALRSGGALLQQQQQQQLLQLLVMHVAARLPRGDSRGDYTLEVDQAAATFTVQAPNGAAFVRAFCALVATLAEEFPELCDCTVDTAARCTGCARYAVPIAACADAMATATAADEAAQVRCLACCQAHTVANVAPDVALSGLPVLAAAALPQITPRSTTSPTRWCGETVAITETPWDSGGGCWQALQALCTVRLQARVPPHANVLRLHGVCWTRVGTGGDGHLALVSVCEALPPPGPMPLLLGGCSGATLLQLTAAVAERAPHDPRAYFDALPVPLLERALLDVARGIAHLHSLSPPLVHQNLHPGSVLIASLSPATLGPVAKVGGLSLSRCRHAVLTAPEALRRPAPPAAPPSDVWSFALLAFSLLFPFCTPFDHLRGDTRYNATGPAGTWNFDALEIGLAAGTVGPRLTAEALHAPIWLPSLLRAAWNYNPSRRPTFARIVAHITGDAPLSDDDSEGVHTQADSEDDTEAAATARAALRRGVLRSTLAANVCARTVLRLACSPRLRSRPSELADVALRLADVQRAVRWTAAAAHRAAGDPMAAYLALLAMQHKPFALDKSRKEDWERLYQEEFQKMEEPMLNFPDVPDPEEKVAV